MKTRRKRSLMVVIAAAVSAVVVAACTTLLIRDYVDALRRAPGDKQRLESLSLAVREDASRAPVLTAEYERQRDATLQRRDRTTLYSWALIAAASLFLVTAKGAVFRRRGSPPTMAQIGVHRGDAARRPERRAKALSSRQGDEAPAPEIDLTFVDEVVAQEGRSKETAITILQRIQSHYRYLPDEALKRVCDLTDISPAQIAGVSTFYSQFRRSPVGRYVVKVCHGTACHVSGATEITDEVRRHLRIARESDTDAQRVFTVDKVACVGCCSLAPVLMIEDETVGRLSPTEACEAIETYRWSRET